MDKKKEHILLKAAPGSVKPIKYRHSSNALFHFMKKDEYLTTALQEKCIYPRYFLEDIKYMGMSTSAFRIEKVGVLGICFCDIPLGNILKKEFLEYDPVIPELSNGTMQKSHIDFYGEYAIAFSKEWAEKHNIQPVHYVLSDSDEIRKTREAFQKSVETEELPIEIAEYFMSELSYKKPLYGYMPRKEEVKGKVYQLKVNKNFHDEHEWRFIPSNESCVEWKMRHRYALDPLVGKKEIIDQEVDGGSNILKNLSDKIPVINDKIICLNFEYTDIRYIIVPNTRKRTEVIDFMTTLFKGIRNKKFRMEIYELMSKIVVLEDIDEDY